VEIDVDADDDAGPDDGAHARDDVALGVVDALRDHRTVQRQQHRVDGHGGLQPGDQLVPERLVARRDGGTGGHGEGVEPEDEVVSSGAGLGAKGIEGAPRVEGGDVADHLPVVGARGHRREGVGLGDDAGQVDPHGRPLPTRWCGSRASRKPSPMKLKARTVITIMTPGKMAMCG
jgi:hypothetical protein